MPLPWKSHPLYRLRASIIGIDLVGFFFSICSLIASIGSWRGEQGIWVVVLILLILSAAFCAWDLCYYAHEKKRLERDGEEGEPQWPCKKLLVADFILMFALFWDYVITLGSIGDYYKPGAAPDYYSNLTTLISALLHGVSFWRELKARMQASFLSRQQAQIHTCPRCTFEYIEPTSNQPSSTDPQATEAAPTPTTEQSRFAAHPGLSHLASLVRQLNRQAEDDLEAGLGAARSRRSTASSAGETDRLVPAGGAQEGRTDGYGSLEVLTPSSDDADVVVKKKKAPRKAIEEDKVEGKRVSKTIRQETGKTGEGSMY